MNWTELTIDWKWGYRVFLFSCCFRDMMLEYWKETFSSPIWKKIPPKTCSLKVDRPRILFPLWGKVFSLVKNGNLKEKKRTDKMVWSRGRKRRKGTVGVVDHKIPFLGGRGQNKTPSTKTNDWTRGKIKRERESHWWTMSLILLSCHHSFSIGNWDKIQLRQSNYKPLLSNILQLKLLPLWLPTKRNGVFLTLTQIFWIHCEYIYIAEVFILL